jgi:hypothetical protein
MWTLFGFDSTSHFVSDGMVGCPKRACDVDVERCAECAALEEYGLDRETPLIRCRGGSSLTDGLVAPGCQP